MLSALAQERGLLKLDGDISIDATVHVDVEDEFGELDEVGLDQMIDNLLSALVVKVDLARVTDSKKVMARYCHIFGEIGQTTA